MAVPPLAVLVLRSTPLCWVVTVKFDWFWIKFGLAMCLLVFAVVEWITTASGHRW